MSSQRRAETTAALEDPDSRSSIASKAYYDLGPRNAANLASSRSAVATFIGGAFWLAFVVLYLSMIGGALGYWRKMLVLLAVSAIFGAVVAGVLLVRRRSKE